TFLRSGAVLSATPNSTFNGLVLLRLSDGTRNVVGLDSTQISFKLFTQSGLGFIEFRCVVSSPSSTSSGLVNQADCPDLPSYGVVSFKDVSAGVYGLTIDTAVTTSGVRYV